MHGLEITKEEIEVNLFGFLKKGTPESVEQTVPETDAPEGVMPLRYITEEEIDKATATLREYMKGKANLDQRVIEDELWWKGQHWKAIRKKMGGNSVEPTSRWLFNTITNKHADMCDNIPQAVVLPREMSDSPSAQTLSSVLPVVLKYNGFEQTYSDNSWELLKHGTAAYGVFWNPPENYVFKNPLPKASDKCALLIYETHVGMAGVEPRVHTYAEFEKNVLPMVNL